MSNIGFMKDRKVKVKLAISPCPNDTFIFGAWIHQWIESDIIPSEVDYLDIQDLNNNALSLHYDVIKVSAAMSSQLLDYYDVLQSGGALGINCGPLLISNKQVDISNIHQYRVGIPGKNTTANFLFDFLFPEFHNKLYLNFAEIEDSVLKNKIDLGVIIHESRFTYQNKGLELIKDLGAYWTEMTGLPIPLGVIMVRKNLSAEIKNEIRRSIVESIRYAQANLDVLMPYIRSYATELDTEVIRLHIDLYVNHYSLDMGIEGKKALSMLHKHQERILAKKI